VNDPSTGGLGGNTYVTAQRFLTNYFLRLNVPGDVYNNKFLVLTDPPRDIPVDTSGVHLTIAPNTITFSQSQAKQIQRALQTTLGLTSLVATNKLVTTAYQQAYNVLRYDNVYGSEFSTAKFTGKIITGTTGDYLVNFQGTHHKFAVTISQLGGLQEITVK
jgi:hypothetical protein